jgi:glycerol kinase
VEPRNGSPTFLAWRLGSTIEYTVEGTVFIGGAVVLWLRDGPGDHQVIV